MRIAVIDDERPARKELIHQILQILPESKIQEADSGSSGLMLISQDKFDILFVDIELNDMEGTTLAAAARKLLPDAQIVFATAYSQYGVKAYELGVNNYILKPFDPARVRTVLEKCRKDLEGESLSAREAESASGNREPAFSSGRMPVNINKTIVFLDIGQIVFIETSGRGCIIHTLQKDYMENVLLGEYEKKLGGSNFCRIHKSFLVNLNYISEIFPWANNGLALKMQGYEQTILPVSREKTKTLRQLLGI